MDMDIMLDLLPQLEEDFPGDPVALWMIGGFLRVLSRDVLLLSAPGKEERVYTILNMGNEKVWVSCSQKEFEVEMGRKSG